eukprot:5282120-Pleurochrysis_carterae.AAC.3
MRTIVSFGCLLAAAAAVAEGEDGGGGQGGFIPLQPPEGALFFENFAESSLDAMPRWRKSAHPDFTGEWDVQSYKEPEVRGSLALAE